MGEVVVIVGAGPAGLATSACLNHLSISNIVLEKEDCCGSLWKKRTYDRLNLHLYKKFCSLPFKQHPPESPAFMSKAAFIQYLDDYASSFNIRPRYYRYVESAVFVEADQKWRIEAKNTMSGEMEVYVSRFLVIATGENGEGYVPPLPGLYSFGGEVLHSSNYKSGVGYEAKEVLVVGCGNSGMEIAYDLSNIGAHASIVVRNPIHVVTKEMIFVGMMLLKYLPLSVVDTLMALLTTLRFGNLSNFGINKPPIGPFTTKVMSGRSPVIDVGTIKKIQAREIKVYPAIRGINKNSVLFDNGDSQCFDVIVLATGYKSLANKWLKDYKYVLNGEGMPKKRFPTHWKGENGVYCAGMSKMGLAGVSMDAKAIANDINIVLGGSKEKLE